MHLWEAGPQRPTELMRVFDTDSASMTRSVQRLERAGLVSREADPDDRRATRVRSTPAGFELRTVIEQVWADLEARTTAGMSDRQRAQLLVQLGRAEQSLSAGQQSGEVGVGTSARRATPRARPGGRRPDPVPGAGHDAHRAAEAAHADTSEAGTSA